MSTYTRSSMETTKTGFTTSTTSIISSESAKTPSKGRKLWTAIKKHAKEHHESVNAAYATYYGVGAMQRPLPSQNGSQESYAPQTKAHTPPPLPEKSDSRLASLDPYLESIPDATTSTFARARARNVAKNREMLTAMKTMNALNQANNSVRASNPQEDMVGRGKVEGAEEAKWAKGRVKRMLQVLKGKVKGGDRRREKGPVPSAERLVGREAVREEGFYQFF
ncbi:hypothetical protein K458DRAFT_387321 [Lentithecium fluviatile CBS 122367]|uniref:Uncharacterized protein n=1 Tax=Lentithecium fluviatile CBS 122367 TaxID=1168545 RepID=A0A6G1J7Z5_9PLEO|nr:hypothetical protein K458DRAFT_387321 [Lentithecium fluviatile CBS 122367]